MSELRTLTWELDERIWKGPMTKLALNSDYPIADWPRFAIAMRSRCLLGILGQKGRRPNPEETAPVGY